MSNELKNTAQWINIPLDLGLVANVEQDVFATDVPFSGAIEANDLDYRSKLGSLKARKTDELELDIPVTYPIIKDYVQEGDGSGGEDPIGMLISTAPETFPSRLLVKGFKNLGGVAQGLLNPTKDGHPIADPNGAYDSTIQHDGKEIRVHGREPKWYGIPRSVNKITYDWPVGFDETDTYDTSQVINDPFGDSNVLAPPKVSDFYVKIGYMMGRGIYYGDPEPPPMWGSTDASLNNPASYNHAYWGVSYLYDGYQESTLTLVGHNDRNAEFPNLGELVEHQGTPAENTARMMQVDLVIRNVSYTSFPFSIIASPSKRIRKIRFYCAPSIYDSSDPLKELTWYLVNEIDVGYRIPDVGNDFVGIYDRYARLSPYNFAVEGIKSTIDDSILGVRIFTESGHIPDVDGSSFVSGMPRFILSGDREERTFSVERTAVTNGSGQERYLELYVYSTQKDSLKDAFLSVGISDFVYPSGTTHTSKTGIILYHAFAGIYVDGIFTNPSHRNYIGNELLTRSTYSQLSGISQTYQDSISPPRKGGYGDGSVQLIYGTTDKDGRTHEGRWQWAMLGTPDRFLPENQDNIKGSIIGVGKTAGNYCIFSTHSIKIGVFTGDALQWSLSDEKYGVGCLSRRTICETPIGLFFLSNEGVRILSGQLPSNPSQEFNLMPPISDAIFELFPTDKEVWKQAVAFYDSARRFYVLHFPTNSQRYNRFCWDMVKREWNSESSESLYYGAGTGVDGYGRIGSSGSSRGLWKYRTSDSLKSSLAKYRVKFDANDPIHNKTIKRLICQFEGEDTAITISCENQNSFQIGARSLNFAPTNLIPINIGLTDRSFSINCSKFESLKSLRLEVENHSTVSNVAIA